jgi:hypothetical protein
MVWVESASSLRDRERKIKNHTSCGGGDDGEDLNPRSELWVFNQVETVMVTCVVVWLYESEPEAIAYIL